MLSLTGPYKIPWKHAFANCFELYHHKSDVSENEKAFNRLQDIVVSTGCCCHDTHNAYHWSLTPLSNEDPELHKRLFVVVESLRKSFCLLRSKLHTFLRQRVRFADKPYDQELLYRFWVTWMVVPNAAEQLAEMGVLHVDGVLWVDAAFKLDVDSMSKLATIYLQCMDFKKLQIADGAPLVLHVEC